VFQKLQHHYILDAFEPIILSEEDPSKLGKGNWKGAARLDTRQAGFDRSTRRSQFSQALLSSKKTPYLLADSKPDF